MQLRTGTARSGDLDIYYEDMGEPTDPAVLLIMGLGSQLLLWRDGFCEKLVAQPLFGRRVARAADDPPHLHRIVGDHVDR